MYLNKAIIVGNLTRDPEQKSLPSGIAVCQFSLATNRVWKDQNGAKQESVDYHNIVVFGRQAETAAQYLRKGQSVMVEGRIQTRSWDNQSGQKQYRTEIVAEKVQFGPKAGGAASGGSSSSSSRSDEGPQPVDDGGQIEYPADEIDPEDIPF